MTVRSFAALVGAALIAIAAAGLLWKIPLTEAATLGVHTVTCSNAITAEPWDGSSKIGGARGELLSAKCADAALPRRAFFGAIGGVGAIALAGVLLVRREPVAGPPAAR